MSDHSAISELVTVEVSITADGLAVLYLRRSTITPQNRAMMSISTERGRGALDESGSHDEGSRKREIPFGCNDTRERSCHGLAAARELIHSALKRAAEAAAQPSRPSGVRS